MISFNELFFQQKGNVTIVPVVQADLNSHNAAFF